MMHKQVEIGGIILALLTFPAAADNPTSSMFSFSGFGTAGIVHSSERDADFVSTPFQASGAGYNHEWSAGVDSLIGAQVTADFSPHLSAVVQLISEQNYDNTYRPHVEWANIKYSFSPDFDIRVGRTVLPTFLFSGTRRVGYTYPWIRPPLDVYFLLPTTSNDGLELRYRQQFGELTNTIEGVAGESTSKVPGGGTVKSRRNLGFSNLTEVGALTTHIVFRRYYIKFTDIDDLMDGFRQFGPQGESIAEKYDTSSKPLSFFGIGATYNPGTWFLTSEWARLTGDDTISGKAAWYISAGYRVGPFTPYVSYAQARASNTSDPGLNLAALPPDARESAATLNQVLNNYFLNGKAVENTYSVGARWDFMENFDFKLQVDRTDIDARTTGYLTNIQPTYRRGSGLTVFSAAIDFVF